MAPSIHDLLPQLKELSQQHIAPVLGQKLEHHIEVIESIYQSMDQFVGGAQQRESELTVLSLLREIKGLKDSITSAVNDSVVIGEEPALADDFPEYFKALEAVILEFPEIEQSVQDRARFKVLPEDKLKIRLGKHSKNFLLFFTLLPQKLKNLARKIGGKERAPLFYWKRSIPLRSMLNWYFRDQLFRELEDDFDEVFKTIASTSDQLWQTESKIDQAVAGILAKEQEQQKKIPVVHDAESMKDLIGQLQQQIIALKSAIDQKTEQVYHDFLNQHQLVGTFELPGERFNTHRALRHRARTEKLYQRNLGKWNNTFMVLNDHYNLDQELYQLRYANLEQYFFTSQKLQVKVNDKIITGLAEIAKFLETQNQKILEASDEEGQLSKEIKEVRYEIAKTLKQQIPATTKLIFDQNLPALIDNLEVKVKGEVDKLAGIRSVVKDIHYDRGIQQSEIARVSPKELIAFEALPNLLKEIKALKSELVHKLEHSQQALIEISEICDFNLGTALAALNEPPQEEKTPKELALEGLQRAIARLSDLDQSLVELQSQTDEKIKSGINEFNLNILALNEISTVFDIRIRIAKAKAVEKTKALKNRALDYVRNLGPRLWSKLRRRWLLLQKYYLETTKRFGIAGAAPTLTAEVSTFLSETDEAIGRLPFVYQRLFEINPLDNANFYELRPYETQKLQRAFQRWQKGHYAATALVGEAGSGTTTLTHFFLEQIGNQHHIVRTETPKQIYKTDDFLNYFSEVFKCDPLENIDDLVTHIQGLETPRIIVVENLQHFFLRKVNGFSCLELFYELISRTNQKIFWITTVNLHAYHYLNKTSNVEDYFAYSVFMQPLKDQQITDIILRRHRVSGYNIWFKPSKSDRKSSRYQKLDEAGRQAYLQKEFFTALNKLANSNITVALIYWLRSTVKVEDDIITMGSIKDLDFSFLANLSSEKLFTLHGLLLHDGLSVVDHAQVFQQAVEKSKLVLILLYEDGITIRKDDRYFINPLLFRQVVNILKSKNILH